MSNGKPVEFYKIISIKEAVPRKIYENDKGLDLTTVDEILNLRMRHQYSEAQSIRKVFYGRTNAKLKWIELTKEPNKSPLNFEYFEHAAKQLFINLIMNDFYQRVPTGADCIVRKLGNTTGYRQINDALEKGMVLADDLTEVDHPDLRKTVYYPTVRMVQGFEELQAKFSFRSILMEGRKETSVHLQDLIEYDKLRLQYLPQKISNILSFNLVEEITTELLKRTISSRNPLVELLSKTNEIVDTKEIEEQRKQDAIGWSDSTMNHVPH